jgi:DNA-binding XRE family transcriptional regulator
MPLSSVATSRNRRGFTARSSELAMLAKFIAEANMTQTSLAVSSGVPQTTISDLVRGDYRPRLDTARAICEALSFELGRPLSVDDVFPPVAHEADATGEEFD